MAPRKQARADTFTNNIDHYRQVSADKSDNSRFWLVVVSMGTPFFGPNLHMIKGIIICKLGQESSPVGDTFQIIWPLSFHGKWPLAGWLGLCLMQDSQALLEGGAWKH